MDARIGTSRAISCLIAISVMVFLIGLNQTALADDPPCTGTQCLKILEVRTGTRCGQQDSVEVDAQNISTSAYMRASAVFDTPKGPSAPSVTGLIPAGGKMNFYTCHGSGKYSVFANTGTDKDKLRYPSTTTAPQAPNVLQFPGRPSEKDIEKGPEWKLYAVGQPSKLGDGAYNLPAWSYQYARRDEQHCPDRVISGKLVDFYAVYENFARFRVLVQKNVIVQSTGVPGYQNFLSCVNATEAQNYPKSNHQTVR